MSYDLGIVTGYAMGRGPISMTEAAAANRGRRNRQEPGGIAGMFNVFPLILVPVLIYNIVAFGGVAMSGEPAAVVANFNSPAFGEGIPMASGVKWVISWGDILVLISMMLLFIELLKSTSTGASAIFNHALSMLVFIICLVEFLLHPAFASSTFFLIMMMSLLDVLAGVVVTIVSARRDVEFGGQ
jgi:hypothetical protein